MCDGTGRLQRASAPPPEASDEIVQHQELLEHRHALALAPELREQLAQPAAPRHVEPERFGEILLRVRRGVGGDVVRQGGRHAASLEIYLLGIRYAIHLSPFPESAAESPGA